MAKINGKNKGNTMERKIAKMLTEWSGHQFNRTPASGGLHWKENNSVTGDIVPPPELQFPFSIEIKKQEVPWDFDFILKGTSHLWDFYKQSARDSYRSITDGAFKEPLLVFSKNHRGIYAIMPYDTYTALLGAKSLVHMRLYASNCELAIVDFETMLSCVTLDEVLQLNTKFVS